MENDDSTSIIQCRSEMIKLKDSNKCIENLTSYLDLY